MSTRKHILVFFAIFGIFLVPVGNIMTIQGRFAKGDDTSIYLVDFDETAYDLYIKGYYPTDYTYADFRRDSIEGMVSHYVATDNNNFSAVVDSIENDVILNGWSVIDDFFQNAWIDLKSGVVTVEEGFTDDFKHELDGRFKSSGDIQGGSFTIGSGTWVTAPYYPVYSTRYGSTYTWQGSKDSGSSPVFYDAFMTSYQGGIIVCSWHTDTFRFYTNVTNNISLGQANYNISVGGVNYKYGYVSNYTLPDLGIQYSSFTEARNDFYNHQQPTAEPTWNGDGYYSDTPTNFSINLPALPSIDWQSISNNNKTKYGVDFPDLDLTIDFQLPDSYYPHTITYDSPYWLYNTDSTPVDWANVSFDDVTLPEVQLSDGDGSFFQALFNTLPLAFVPILLGVILCYLIFLML